MSELSLSHSENVIKSEQEPVEDDMYWVAFRLLTVSRQYEAVSSDELYAHLKKNDVLIDGDTPETVCAEVLSWADTIEQDATEKGRPGKLVYIDKTDSISFAALSTEAASELVRRQTASRLSSLAVRATIQKPMVEDVQEVLNQKLVKPVEETKVQQPEEEVSLPEIITYEVPTENEVLSVILESGGREGVVRQQTIKASFIPAGIDNASRMVLQDSIQTVIESLCSQGLISKSTKNNARWLHVTSAETVKANPEKKNHEEIDRTFAIMIFQSLRELGAHWQQRFSVKELWDRMNTESAFTKEIEVVLKRQCRLLAEIDILEKCESKLNTSSSGTSKGAKKRVFKLGFASQQAKEAAIKATTNNEALTQLLNGEFSS